MRPIVLLLVALVAVVGCTKKDTSSHESHAGASIVPNAIAATSAPPVSRESTPPIPEAGAPPQPTTRFVGRWVKDGNGMRCSWAGCYVVGRFTGTGISARIKDDGFNLLQVIVDGELKKVLTLQKAKGETTYVLAEALPDGVHEVSIHKRTESKVGEMVFYSFVPKDGKMVPGAPPPDRRIETLGDSITAGWGNEGPGGSCGYVNSEQNEYLTYGAITARNLNADHSTIAWSGRTQYEMRLYFDKSLPGARETEGPKWDFSQWQPHVLVINLGTNDFANVDPGEARFVRQYLELMKTVRTAYPQAFIVVALGSMLSDIYPETRKNLTQARRYFKIIVAKLKEQGETNFDFLEFPEQNHADGLGCGFHPSLKTHKLMADRLTALLKERMSW